MEKDFAMLVFTKVVHLDEVLDEVQRVQRVWFKNLLIQGLKVGKMLKFAQVTIITCNLEISFLFFLV
jgi:hypothetical protein